MAGKLAVASVATIEYIFDKINHISNLRDELSEILQSELNFEQDDLNRYLIYMKLAETHLKGNNYRKEKECLEKALEIRPEDFLANFRLAVALERSGNGDYAIERYKLAINVPEKISSQLKSFVDQQISSVLSTGPREKPPMPGLRFITW